MNPYLKQLNKIEFVVTDACTGRCRHCSEGDHTSKGFGIDPEIAAGAVQEVATEYDVQTLMTFGGEPLLYPKTVCAIHRMGMQVGIPHRQVITNGYFSREREKMREVAQMLAHSGVNDLLLSVDAFHQETIPLETVKAFAEEAMGCNIPVRLSPAWLVSADHDNPYNQKTREILSAFSDLAIPQGAGNVVFFEGNARKYLAAYFTDVQPQNPYEDDPRNVRCLSIGANGDVLGGNLYRESVMDIIRRYQPQQA